tara:strand:- start:739 stop:996 length:258 start_codon:yes stop_codon:yes gene_type:complete
MNNKQETPSWFTGSTYSEGSVVLNPFSGDTYELNAVELSMYDFIMGCQHMWAMGIEPSAGTLDEFERSLKWFTKNNIKAYMALLD